MRKVIAHTDLQISPYKIIKAFTDPVMLKAWWGVERTLVELEVGGVYMLVWQISEHGFKYVSTGIVERYQPEKELLIKNCCYFNSDRPILGPMIIHIWIETIGPNNRLFVSQSGYQSGNDWDWYYHAVKEAWPIALKNLKAYLESK